MIHRTRQGEKPSGGPEDGRKLAQIGNIWIEYSGPKPNKAELAEHLNPSEETQE